VAAHVRIYYSKDLRVDGRMLLKWSVKKYVWWMCTRLFLVQDRDKWGAVVNTAMNIRFP
jgi:hypothetical protein